MTKQTPGVRFLFTRLGVGVSAATMLVSTWNAIAAAEHRPADSTDATTDSTDATTDSTDASIDPATLASAAAPDPATTDPARIPPPRRPKPPPNR